MTWNPHPALNFPLKYTTFHVTHTNPAAISLSLNRAESLYLNSLAEYGTAVVRIVVTGWRGPKGEATELCLSLTLSPAWPLSLPLNSTVLWSWLFSSTRVYLTILYSASLSRGSQTAPGLLHQPANTSHKKHRARTHTQHIHRHFHTNRVS